MGRCGIVGLRTVWDRGEGVELGLTEVGGIPESILNQPRVDRVSIGDKSRIYSG